MLTRPDVIADVAEAMKGYLDSIEFSVKMSLGVKDTSEAMGLLDVLNSMKLRHMAVHPRTVSQ